MPSTILNENNEPHWWGSDEEATQQALAAARALGFNPDAMMN